MTSNNYNFYGRPIGKLEAYHLVADLIIKPAELLQTRVEVSGDNPELRRVLKVDLSDGVLSVRMPAGLSPNGNESLTITIYVPKYTTTIDILYQVGSCTIGDMYSRVGIVNVLPTFLHCGTIRSLDLTMNRGLAFVENVFGSMELFVSEGGKLRVHSDNAMVAKACVTHRGQIDLYGVCGGVGQKGIHAFGLGRIRIAELLGQTVGRLAEHEGGQILIGPIVD